MRVVSVRASVLVRSMLFGVLCSVAACAQAPYAATDDATDVANGRAIAEAQCGGCHATAGSGASPRSDAPPFRSILKRYRQDALSEELINGIKIGHPDMPVFTINPQGVDDLIAYLQSIERPDDDSGVAHHP